MSKTDEFIETFKFVFGTLLVQRLAERCPVDTGELKNSIRFVVTKDGIEVIMAKHAVYVEFGTMPHVIEAVNKKALKFQMSGKTVFAKRVYHPGTSPSPFIRPTFHQDLQSIVNEAAEIAKLSVGV